MLRNISAYGVHASCTCVGTIEVPDEIVDEEEVYEYIENNLQNVELSTIEEVELNPSKGGFEVTLED